MIQSGELAEILSGYFKWNKARLHCFAGMLLALIRVRTVNLRELACGFDSNVQMESRYRRIRRFLSGFLPKQETVARWVMAMFGLEGTPVTLSIDRTNWKWGKKNINILMLSAVYRGTALPLFWMLLPKRGNSSTAERIKIIKRFIRCFGRDSIDCLLGDREFIGEDWLAWLLEKKIHFCIRIKDNFVTVNEYGVELLMRQLFHDLRRGETRIIHDKRKVLNHALHLSALKLMSGEFLILISDRLLDDPISLYGKRWEIETLFGCLKGRGFNFEDTHVTKPKRISSLIALLTVAFCWSHRTGEWRHECKPIIVRKHGRPSFSFFRYGLDYLRDKILHCAKSAKEMPEICLDFLKKPPLINRIVEASP